MLDIYAFYERADGTLCVKERIGGATKSVEWGTSMVVCDRHRGSTTGVIDALGAFVAAATLGAENGLHLSGLT